MYFHWELLGMGISEEHQSSARETEKRLFVLARSIELLSTMLLRGLGNRSMAGFKRCGPVILGWYK